MDMIAAEDLRTPGSEQVGVNLQIGTASFPDEAITFENLVEKAVTKMKTSTADETQPSRRAKDLAAKRVTA